jgi:hypothetical protein
LVDAVVSFETIEHFYEHDQFLAEVRRVLRPGGRFIVSSPERDVYSPTGSNANPYHARELSRKEFVRFLRNSFAHVRLLGQRAILGSALVSEEDGSDRTLTFEKRGPRHFETSIGLPRPVYLVAIASDQPVIDVPDSVYIETTEIGAALAAARTAEAAASALASVRSELAQSIQQANEQAESYRQQLSVAEQASHEHAARARSLDAELAEARAQAIAARADAETARAAIEAARAEAATACSQRDIARVAARRAMAVSEGHWRGRVTELEWQAAEPRHTPPMKAMLANVWIRRASRLMPAPVRRLVRYRLLAWGGR